ncbi:flagellin [Robinsoniella peoriensis]|uniref:flagellin N-terminal helical domain-containing protein n=1 Tax=Robinsoniella peoriensis TaxID=180332 RepID=UPI00085BD1DA|nr:flagellin [Robinsoniella peoriensis]
MIIQHNIMALNSHRQLKGNNSATSKSLEKLSSGFKINRAGDDAAGLAVSEKMRAQIKGLEAASANAQDAISLVQTAEGGLQEVHSILNRMTELATKASNGTYDNKVDRKASQDEMDALLKEIDRISSSTNFNGINLLDGKLGQATADLAGYDKASLNAAFSTTAKIAVTDVEGITLTNIGGNVKMAANGTSGNLDVTVTDADGNATTTSLNLADYVKNKDGSAFTPGVKGVEGYVDLTSVGLGKISFITTDTAGTVANIQTDLVAKFGTAANVTAAAGGGAGTGLKLQIGETSANYNQLEVSIKSMDTASLQIQNLKIDTPELAKAAIDKVKDAINQVSDTRGQLGAVQNRLEHTINNLGVTTENITAAESRIRDVDMAKEMMEFTKNNVLMQSAQAMLAQANQQPQSVLQLLR